MTSILSVLLLLLSLQWDRVPTVINVLAAELQSNDELLQSHTSASDHQKQVLLRQQLWQQRQLLPWSAFATTDAPKKYFLSMIVMNYDEDNVIELVQHYLEEGVDHFFFHYGSSSTHALKELQSCIPAVYYTMLKPPYQFQVHRNPEDYKLMSLRHMYEVQGVREKSEWVTVVDANELMTSRTMPNMTIREILQRKMGNCHIISVPWLIFSWGKQNSTVPNYSRYSLFDRWGFDDKFAIGPSTGVLRNINKSIFSRMIIRTKFVPTIRSFRYTDFRRSISARQAHVGTVCISHEYQHMLCALPHVDVANQILKDQLVHKKDPMHAFAFTAKEAVPLSGTHGKGLPAWCPPRNQLTARNSPHSLMVAEDDIEHLDLVVFHYRYRSLQEWQTKGGRSDTASASRQANRMDVRDTFMKSVRLKAREKHESFTTAADVIDNCRPHGESNALDAVVVKDTIPLSMDTLWNDSPDSMEIAPPEPSRVSKMKPSGGASVDHSKLGRGGEKYLVSVFTVISKAQQLNGIIEFVQHYVEEGVDHFFIYCDDKSNSAVLFKRMKGCVSEQLYTVYTSSDLTSAPMDRNETNNHDAMRQVYSKLDIGKHSRWVIFVNTNEFIASRTMPDTTLCSILRKEYADCDLITVPSISYDASVDKKIPTEGLRYSYFNRLYLPTRSIGDSDPLDFDHGSDIAVVVRSQAVPVDAIPMYQASQSTGRDALKLRICVASSSQQLACAQNNSSQTTTESRSQLQITSLRTVDDSKYKFGDAVETQAAPRHAWCPPSNRFIGYVSTARVALTEDDINDMDILVFRYNIDSDYDETTQRLVDRYMQEERLLERLGSPEMEQGKKLFDACLRSP